MSRGRIPGSGPAQARILAALAGGETLRSAELAERAQVNHHALSKATRAMLDAGLIVACMVQPAKGNKTLEYRLGPGRPVQEFKPLQPKKSGVAASRHRSSSGPLPPIPKTTPAPVVAKVAPPRASPNDDAAMLRQVQAMSEADFAEYIRHLARVWSWHRADKLVATAMGGA